MGKSSALKAATKEAESELDVTSIMLAREQVHNRKQDGWVRMICYGGRQKSSYEQTAKDEIL